MRLLSIETSCDESAISLVEIDKAQDNFSVLADITISQIETHIPYGGVFPALAKREHAKNLPIIFQEIATRYSEEVITLDEEKRRALEEIFQREKGLAETLISLFSDDNFKLPHIDAIAVTNGPGLSPALWTGVNFARAISLLTGAPIYPTNHMEGHISSILLKENYLKEEQALFPLDSFSFPMLALLISGGHTQLVLVKGWNNYFLIGETLDDAVGEAFDKVARMLGMEYPGGPKISARAKEGRVNEEVSLPRPMIHSDDYRFSFSGLKTAVRYLIENLKEKYGELSDQLIADIALEFEESVTEVLVKKTQKAIEAFSARGLIIAGGVSANERIVSAFQELTQEEGIELFTPQRFLCGDNALMIATSAFLKIRDGESGLPAGSQVEVDAHAGFPPLSLPRS